MKTGVPHNRGKRYKEKKLNKKKIFGVICIVILIIVISIVSYGLLKNDNPTNQTEENPMNTAEENDIDENINSTEEQEEQQEPTVDETIGSDLPDTMGNYKVIGELVIDKIGVKNNILNTVDGLDVSVTKFYGPTINSPGNFCIIGHNYTKMLKRLKELKVGDTFYVIGKEEHTKITYKIYNIYTCNPKDLKCLNQNKDGKREVTLITCNPGGLTRLICKAKEV